MDGNAMTNHIRAEVDYDGRFPIAIYTPAGKVELTLNEAKHFIHELVTVANIVGHREEAERKYREVIYMKEIRNAA